jgi:formylmethanofuran dehydrogenase subunit D
MQKIKVTLLSGRTIDQGVTKEHSKLSEAYHVNVAICEIDPSDLVELGVKENSTVKVSTKHGAVVVKAKVSKRAPHPKIVYMPYGFWANVIVGPETHGTGMPSYKGVAAEIQSALTEDVSSIQQLLRSIGRNRRRQ